MELSEKRQKAEQKKFTKGLAIALAGAVAAVVAYYVPWKSLSILLWAVAVGAMLFGIIRAATARVGIKHGFALAIIILATWFLTSLTPDDADAVLILLFPLAYVVGLGIDRLSS